MGGDLYTGPETGDFDPRMAALAYMANRQQAEALAQTVPIYTGPPLAPATLPVPVITGAGSYGTAPVSIPERGIIHVPQASGRGHSSRGRSGGGKRHADAGGDRDRTPRLSSSAGRGGAGSKAKERRAALSRDAAYLITATVVISAGLRMWRAESLGLLPLWVASLFAAWVCMLTAVRPRTFVSREMATGRTVAVVPAYNEDEEALYACVRSLLEAEPGPGLIIVVDDGSNPAPRPYVHPRVSWIRHENTGKRGAQAEALRSISRDDFDFILTVDSDSEIRPDALGHLLRAMSDKRVQAATGWIWVRNWKENWVTRGADMDIGVSCVSCRASRSALGALETTSGALALYRSEIFYDHLDEYISSSGVNTGDDRWMNLRALRRGQTVGVNEAIVETDMPPTLKVMFRQRRRWGQSWWQAIPYAYRHLRPVQLIWTTFELAYMFSYPVVLCVLARNAVEGRVHLGVAWLIGFVTTYLLSIVAQGYLYVHAKPVPWRDKLSQMTYGMISMILLEQFIITPAKYWALFTIKRTTWSTR